MAESDARAALARIEANVGHLTEHTRETRAICAQTRSELQDLKVDNAGAQERIVAAVQAVDTRVGRHEGEDDRRFRSVHSRLDRIVGSPDDDTSSRAKKIAKFGGSAVGGGGFVLVVLELLKLMKP